MDPEENRGQSLTAVHETEVPPPRPSQGGNSLPVSSSPDDSVEMIWPETQNLDTAQTDEGIVSVYTGQENIAGEIYGHSSCISERAKQAPTGSAEQQALREMSDVDELGNSTVRNVATLSERLKTGEMSELNSRQLGAGNIREMETHDVLDQLNIGSKHIMDGNHGSGTAGDGLDVSVTVSEPCGLGVSPFILENNQNLRSEPQNNPRTSASVDDIDRSHARGLGSPTATQERLAITVAGEAEAGDMLAAEKAVYAQATVGAADIGLLTSLKAGCLPPSVESTDRLTIVEAGDTQIALETVNIQGVVLKTEDSLPVGSDEGALIGTEHEGILTSPNNGTGNESGVNASDLDMLDDIKSAKAETEERLCLQANGRENDVKTEASEGLDASGTLTNATITLETEGRNRGDSNNEPIQTTDTSKASGLAEAAEGVTSGYNDRRGAGNDCDTSDTQSDDDFVSSAEEASTEADVPANEGEVGIPVLSDESVVYFNDQHSDQLIQCLKKQRDEAKYCDIVVSIGDKTYNAHRCVLASNSSSFHTMLEDPDVKDLHLDSVTRPVFDALLEYLYGGQLSVSMSNAAALMAVCEELGIDDVKQCCSLHLTKNINATTWYYIKEQAERFDLADVGKHVTEFLTDKLTSVAKSPNLMKLPFSLIEEVINNCNPSRSAQLEACKLEVILRWVKHSWDARVEHLPSLVNLVCCEHLTKGAMKAVLKARSLRHKKILEHHSVVSVISKVRECHRRRKVEAKIARKRAEEERNNRKRERQVLLEGMAENVYCKGGRNLRFSSRKYLKVNLEQLGQSLDEDEDVLDMDAVDDEDAGLKEDHTYKPHATTLGMRRPRKALRPRKVKTAGKGVNFDEQSDHEVEELEVPERAPNVPLTEIPVKRKRGRPKGSTNKNKRTQLLSKRVKVKVESDLPLGGDMYTAVKTFPDGNEPGGLGRETEISTGRLRELEPFPVSSGFDAAIPIKRKRGRPRKGTQPIRYVPVKSPWRNRNTLTPAELQSSQEEESEAGISATTGTFTPEQISAYPYQCVVCNKRFVLRRHIKRHEKIHLEKHLVCKICDYRTRRNDKLRDHIRRVHPDTAVEIGIITPEKLQQRRELLEAKRVERAAMPKVRRPRKRRVKLQPDDNNLYSCGKCPRSFTTPSGLRHHLKGHGAETPFLCEICGFSTRHFASMNVHKRHHNGKKFRCTYPGCKYENIRKSRLTDHMNAHSGIKNHVCSVCGKAFAGRKHMQRHEKVHVEVKPLLCEHCSYRTTRRDKLHEHIRKHHVAVAVVMGLVDPNDLDEERRRVEAGEPSLKPKKPHRKKKAKVEGGKEEEEEEGGRGGGAGVGVRVGAGGGAGEAEVVRVEAPKRGKASSGFALQNVAKVEEGGGVIVVGGAPAAAQHLAQSAGPNGTETEQATSFVAMQLAGALAATTLNEEMLQQYFAQMATGTVTMTTHPTAVLAPASLASPVGVQQTLSVPGGVLAPPPRSTAVIHPVQLVANQASAGTTATVTAHSGTSALSVPTSLHHHQIQLQAAHQQPPAMVTTDPNTWVYHIVPSAHQY